MILAVSVQFSSWTQINTAFFSCEGHKWIRRSLIQHRDYGNPEPTLNTQLLGKKDRKKQNNADFCGFALTGAPETIELSLILTGSTEIRGETQRSFIQPITRHRCLHDDITLHNQPIRSCSAGQTASTGSGVSVSGYISVFCKHRRDFMCLVQIWLCQS